MRLRSSEGVQPLVSTWSPEPWHIGRRNLQLQLDLGIGAGTWPSGIYGQAALEPVGEHRRPALRRHRVKHLAGDSQLAFFISG